MTDHDIVVVGGGLVGTPLALALDAIGLRVALLERRGTPVRLPDDPLDQRCTALSAGSVAWLESRGLWSALAPDACPIGSVHVSHRGHFGATRLTAAEEGVAALGHVVENRRVLGALDARLATSGVHRLAGRTLVSIEHGDAVSRVHHAAAERDGDRGDADDTLVTRLVVGVDGVDSAVRTALGIGVRRHDYRQSAVLGTLRLERDHGHVAHERFTDSGPLALLPRPERIVSFIECATPDGGERLGGLDDEAYLAHLQARFGRRLGRFTALGPRSVVPLARIEAERQSGPRALLLGNAARLLHPVAGQGYNLALRDVASLVGRLAHTPGDPGEAALLDAFVTARRGDRRRVVALTDTLARTFRGENAALSHLRALGLVGLDTVAPLRRRFARAAMGTGG